MDLFQIIDDIAQVEPEVYDRFDSRRAAFRHFLGFGKKVTAAALPLALPALFNKAYGQTTSLPSVVVDALNLALQLEYLEKYFYQTALASSILNSEQSTAFSIILNDENAHISTLRAVLGSNAIGDPGRAAFDYTGSQGATRAPLFPAVFQSVNDFLFVGQNFVDTGVRAYKGASAALIGQKDLLETAFRIHSVEARHAARIRSFRRGGVQSTAAPKSWISPSETYPPLPNGGGAGAPATVGPYLAGANASLYPAESNTTQVGVNLQAVVSGVSATAGAEAFDEPLDAATVKAIAKNFAANPTTLFN